MNKLLILFVLLLLVSCNKKTNSTITDNSAELDLDTLKDNAIFFLDTISANEFFALEENENVFCNCYENAESDIDDSNVTRTGNVLSFQLQNGEVKELTNTSQGGNYCYKNSFSEINQWLVCGLCGDEHSYSFFIDKFNGEETWAASRPVFSPDKKYFVCYKMNWTDYHTIQLFKVDGKNKKIELVWYKLLTDWGANDIRWKDDKTIFIEKSSMKTTGEDITFDNKYYVQYPLDKYIN